MEKDLELLTARLRHLLLTEQFGLSGARNSVTKKPICFKARSVRAAFGISDQMDDRELTELKVWPEILSEPPQEDVASLGPSFSESLLDSTDVPQLVRRMVYLWEEEDLRTDMFVSNAVHSIDELSPLDLFRAIVDFRNPAERAVMRLALKFTGWARAEYASDEEAYAVVAAELDRYPAQLEGADDELLEKMRSIGLLSGAFVRSR